VTPRTFDLVEMSSISAGTSFFSGSRLLITPSSYWYCSTLRRRSSTVPLAKSCFALSMITCRLSISASAVAICAAVGCSQQVQNTEPTISITSVIRSMYWLCRSWGRRATGLPHRLGEGDGPDVHRVRDLVAQRHVERRHRPILVDHRRRCGGRHVGEPGRSGELPQKRRV